VHTHFANLTSLYTLLTEEIHHDPTMSNMNVFRILGDVSHTVSVCILIWAIHSNKSAEGEQDLALNNAQF